MVTARLPTLKRTDMLWTSPSLATSTLNRMPSGNSLMASEETMGMVGSWAAAKSGKKRRMTARAAKVTKGSGLRSRGILPESPKHPEIGPGATGRSSGEDSGGPCSLLLRLARGPRKLTYRLQQPAQEDIL